MSLIGIDVGTSAVKAAAFRENGACLATVRAPVFPHLPRPGWWELDPKLVWSATRDALSELSSHPALRNDPPQAIAISASGDEIFPVDAAGDPLANCILSGDTRGAGLEAEITSWAEDSDWYAWCGHVPERMDPALRILWWFRHMPDIAQAARYFLDWHSFLTFQLCGTPATDRSLAAKSMLFDPNTNAWSAERTERLGLDATKLPGVEDWGTALGILRPELRTQFELNTDIAICVGAFDSSCAALGSGVSTPGTVGLACGSWEVLVAPVDDLPMSRRLIDSRFPVVAHPGEANQAVLAQSPNGTAVTDWSARLMNTSVANLNARVESSSLDPGPILAIPHLSGAISPWSAGRDSRAAFLGMTLATTSADLHKALMESIAMDLALTLRLLLAVEIPCKVVRAAGGGTRSAWWMQLKSDLAGVPIEVVEHPEPGAFGAALLAGSAVGIFEVAGRAAEALSQVKHRYSPSSARAEFYADRLAAYREAVEAIMPINRSFTDE